MECLLVVKEEKEAVYRLLGSLSLAMMHYWQHVEQHHAATKLDVMINCRIYCSLPANYNGGVNHSFQWIGLLLVTLDKGLMFDLHPAD